MIANEWKTRIISSCEDAGTYRECFADAIEALATILEKRDDAMNLYSQSNMKPVIMMPKGGVNKPCKNPILAVWCELNAQALAYWRELGLTPSGLRALGKDLNPKKGTTLSALLQPAILNDDVQ